MAKNYIVTDQTLEIKDDLKTQFFGIKLLFITWIIIGILSLIETFKGQNELWNYIRIILGFFAIIGLYDYHFKKSSQSKILISEIESVKERRFLGTNRYFILLKNGRKRALPEITNSVELENIKRLINL